jgi:plasmid stabilization system protein ParE
MRVRFTPAALEDVAEISQSHEASVAARLEDAVFTAADRLGERPELGVATDDEDARRWPMPGHGFAIFYRVDRQNERLEVLRVIDGRRVRNLERVPR